MPRSHHSWITGRLLLTSCLVLLVACTSLQPVKPQSITTFSLNPELPLANAARSDALTIAVSAPRAMPGFDTSRMAYVNKPLELSYFSRNQWVDAPARMIAPHLVRALERSGHFLAVVESPNSIVTDLKLDSELIRLQQDFTTNPSKVRLTLRAQVVDVAEGKVLGTREFDATEPAPSDDPYGGVIAANKALARVLVPLAEFCGNVSAEKRKDTSSAQR
ncbi:MAG: ABC-type transport auxiliary lipoprotein family protein [Gammaproteobacteria bacterium]